MGNHPFSASNCNLSMSVEKEEKIVGLDADIKPPTKITLVSAGENPEKFEIERANALMSRLVYNILEGDETAKEIQVKQVEAKTLRKIIDYLNHHKGKEPAEIAKPIRSVKMEKIVEDEEDAKFITKLAKKELFQIILGANYMDIKPLLHLGCACVATMIKGKSPEEIKAILGEENNDKKN